MDGLFQTKRWWSWCTNFTKEMVSDNYQNWIEAHLMKETSVTSFIHWSTTLGIQSNIRRLVTKTKVIFFRVNQKTTNKNEKGWSKYKNQILQMTSSNTITLLFSKWKKIVLTLLGVSSCIEAPACNFKKDVAYEKSYGILYMSVT